MTDVTVICPTRADVLSIGPARLGSDEYLLGDQYKAPPSLRCAIGKDFNADENDRIGRPYDQRTIFIA